METALKNTLQAGARRLLSGMPSGFDALALGALAGRAFADRKAPHLHLARDDGRLYLLADAVRFFAPDCDIILFPAWDCQPYDRVGPNSDIIAQRLEALAILAKPTKRPRLVLTTVNAALQRVVTPAVIKAQSIDVITGDERPMDDIISFITAAGYRRSDQVTEAGEFAVRGGLLDVFPVGEDYPLRLDFFGDEVDAIRRFDPIDQRTIGPADRFKLMPASEIAYDADSIRRFRRTYVNTFGPATTDHDPLYEAISDGRRFQGAEHWAPFFHSDMATLFDYLPKALLTLDHQWDAAAQTRLKAIDDYYESRREAMEIAKKDKLRNAPLYKPAPPESLYLAKDEFDQLLNSYTAHAISPFGATEGEASIDYGARTARNFSPERNSKGANLYDAVKAHIKDAQAAKKRVVITSYSKGSADRLAGVLKDQGLAPLSLVENWADIRKSKIGLISVAPLALETGFETDDLLVFSEQDLLGDKLVRRARKTTRADNFLKDATTLAPGDLVVHASHGIGRFIGLESVTVTGAPHDCLRLEYHGADKLFVPVENIEILSRYGDADMVAQLDKLGGVAWQARKAKMKQRIKEMADALIKLAAKRAMRQGQKIDVPEGAYESFCARFPYQETDDQERAILDVVTDFASGKPMDRLVCGDVGFGKTEVALRAAFLAVMSGMQVAIIAPTTLLARQHMENFQERFKGFPVRIGQLSRMVSASMQKANKEEMAKGTLDIVIGTHALLGKNVEFKNLGLVIVDEEQHFGVAHKERLKQLRADVHILTLTATPIPRTLQMAMSGIRDLSIIASPPVDRLAVRTFVLPFDPLILREALLRERFRGGQSFMVVPRIADIEEAAAFLKEQVPEVKFIIGHGQMPPSTLEDVMTAFYEGQYDVLLSTTIIESGIDIPRANTLVVYRADMFGLAQLYQIRGRVGRSKTRAYAYLTTPAGKPVSDNADKRLQVLQSLDTLGAGFSIASHDMDIRGAGNLLGDEQSGHIKEVGVELYQKMLEDAVAAARAGVTVDDGEYVESDWSPQLNLGATVLIPEPYVPDLGQRMALYRRLGDLGTRDEVDAYCAELIDRFGPLPREVKQLAAIMTIKSYAKRAGIEKLDAGPRGMTFTFRGARFANPAGLVAFISNAGASAKVRPDHSLVYQARMDKIGARLKAVASVTRKLAQVAEQTP